VPPRRSAVERSSSLVIDEGASRQERCQTVMSRPQTEIEILEGEEIGVFQQATPLEGATVDEHEAAAHRVNDPCAGQFEGPSRSAEPPVLHAPRPGVVGEAEGDHALRVTLREDDRSRDARARRIVEAFAEFPQAVGRYEDVAIDQQHRTSSAVERLSDPGVHSSRISQVARHLAVVDATPDWREGTATLVRLIVVDDVDVPQAFLRRDERLHGGERVERGAEVEDHRVDGMSPAIRVCQVRLRESSASWMLYFFGRSALTMSEGATEVVIPKRALFKATEVCEIVKVQPYVLRSWEVEFPALGVAKNAGASRFYRRVDVELALRIKHLLLVEGLTLAGARRRLEDELSPVAADDPAIDVLIGRNARERLTEVKRGLRWILDLLGEVGTGDFRLTAPATRSVDSRPSGGRGRKAPRRKGAGRSAASRRRKHSA
jgi:DNA-binding transcriptional MerR regulator